jgi:hypothetical protein
MRRGGGVTPASRLRMLLAKHNCVYGVYQIGLV